MHQKDKIGGGEATDEVYTTWEMKECPGCGRVVRESYEVTVINNGFVPAPKDMREVMCNCSGPYTCKIHNGEFAECTNATCSCHQKVKE